MRLRNSQVKWVDEKTNMFHKYLNVTFVEMMKCDTHYSYRLRSPQFGLHFIHSSSILCKVHPSEDHLSKVGMNTQSDHCSFYYNYIIVYFSYYHIN
jgi:hypothetical protein